jgi:hypothetical protein
VKYFYFLILMFLFTIETSAQIFFDSADLTVVQKKWKANALGQINSALDEDPLNANDDVNQRIQDQKENVRQNAVRLQSNRPLESPPVRFNSPNTRNRNERLTSYTYQIKVRNNGTKTIKKVVWEYVFLDPLTNRELGRHQFTSKTNIEASETGNLVMKNFSPPSNSIAAKDAGKKGTDLYKETILIKSVEFEDD